MSPAAIVALALFAFLSAPAAFILLWIFYRQSGSRAVRDLAFAVLGATFALLGNLLTAVVEGTARVPYGVYVLLLDEVTMATIGAGAFVCRFAHGATQTPLKPASTFAFWSFAFLLHLLVLSTALLPGAGGEAPSVSKGFALATLGSLVMVSYASIVILAGRRRITPDFFIPRLTRAVPPLLFLSFLSAANDIFQFGRLLGGVGIPFSPFFSILVNGFIIVIVGRRLVSGGPATFNFVSSTVDFGLTLRESEILPLLLGGASNEEIGERLHISPHTVKNHITAIYRKTGTESRFDLLKVLGRTGAD